MAQGLVDADQGLGVDEPDQETVFVELLLIPGPNPRVFQTLLSNPSGTRRFFSTVLLLESCLFKEDGTATALPVSGQRVGNDFQ